MTERLEVVLDEASGPVSPRFQYALRVEIADDGTSASVRSADAGPKKRQEARDLAPGDTALLRAALAASAEWRSSPDLAGSERRAGSSVNTLTVRLGDAEARVTYRLHHAKDLAWLGAIVGAVKKLAWAAGGEAPAPVTPASR
ncbi:MAG: hypothetical protein JNL38_29625 [Myxococcales bacterium]|nr:hypothetical protein [Myxococcales bacterium]